MSINTTVRGPRRWCAAVLTIAAVLIVGCVGSAPIAMAEPQLEPPRVVDQLLPAARDAINAEWYFGKVPIDIEVTPTVPPQVGEVAAVVVDQKVLRYPEDGRTRSATAVINLIVGSRTPNLIDSTLAQARKVVHSLGLELGIPAQQMGEDWLVSAQSIPEGTLLTFGSVVAVKIRAPPITTTPATVPDLGGLTEAQARVAVARLPMGLQVISSTGAGERLIRWQDPAPGATAKLRGTVRVVLEGTGPPPVMVTVPDVTGLDRAAVEEALRTVRLGVSLEPAGDDADQELALRQTPPPGAQVVQDTVVTVWFGSRAAGAASSARSRQWTVVGLSALLVVMGGLYLVRRTRPHARSPRPPRIQPHADPNPLVSIRAGQAGADLAIRVRPQADVGHQSLEEVPS